MAVVGATGNVGRLVVNRLLDLDEYRVNAIVRDQARGVEAFKPRESLKVFAADTKDGSTLDAGLTGTECVIVCTGTTAFPTKAWAGGNTPEAVDNLGVKNILQSWCRCNEGSSLKRLVLMSSIGVQKRNQFPFLILNLGGVLTAKDEGERAVKAAAQQHSFDWTIVRPGQLFGGPYDNNFYLGTLFQLDKDASVRQLEMQAGDSLLGDTLRSSLAEVLVQSAVSESTANCDFSVINTKGEPPSNQQLEQMFAQLSSA